MTVHCWASHAPSTTSRSPPGVAATGRLSTVSGTWIAARGTSSEPAARSRQRRQLDAHGHPGPQRLRVLRHHRELDREVAAQRIARLRARDGRELDDRARHVLVGERVERAGADLTLRDLAVVDVRQIRAHLASASTRSGSVITIMPGCTESPTWKALATVHGWFCHPRSRRRWARLIASSVSVFSEVSSARFALSSSICLTCWSSLDWSFCATRSRFAPSSATSALSCASLLSCEVRRSIRSSGIARVELRLVERDLVLRDLELLLGDRHLRHRARGGELVRRVAQRGLLLIEALDDRAVVEVEHAIAGLHDRAVLGHPPDRQLPRVGARHLELDLRAGVELAGQHGARRERAPRA